MRISNHVARMSNQATGQVCVGSYACDFLNHCSARLRLAACKVTVGPTSTTAIIMTRNMTGVVLSINNYVHR
jgi:hypothetical protein